jgi:anti-anti-sigma regulatory factor
MDLHIHVDRPRGELLLVFSGTLDRGSARELTDALRAFDAPSFDLISVDVSDCRIADRVGAEALDSASRGLSAAGRRFQLIDGRGDIGETGPATRSHDGGIDVSDSVR